MSEGGHPLSFHDADADQADAADADADQAGAADDTQPWEQVDKPDGVDGAQGDNADAIPAKAPTRTRVQKFSKKVSQEWLNLDLMRSEYQPSGCTSFSAMWLHFFCVSMERFLLEKYILSVGSGSSACCDNGIGALCVKATTGRQWQMESWIIHLASFIFTSSPSIFLLTYFVLRLSPFIINYFIFSFYHILFFYILFYLYILSFGC